MKNSIALKNYDLVKVRYNFITLKNLKKSKLYFDEYILTYCKNPKITINFKKSDRKTLSTILHSPIFKYPIFISYIFNMSNTTFKRKNLDPHRQEKSIKN